MPRSEKPQQARGKELREKMIESEIYGEEYRKRHQGADVRKEVLRHPNKNKENPQKSR